MTCRHNSAIMECPWPHRRSVLVGATTCLLRGDVEWSTLDVSLSKQANEPELKPGPPNPELTMEDNKLTLVFLFLLGSCVCIGTGKKTGI